eukprot:Colp12_sorted_trinity150504_noHs@2938
MWWKARVWTSANSSTTTESERRNSWTGGWSSKPRENGQCLKMAAWDFVEGQFADGVVFVGYIITKRGGVQNRAKEARKEKSTWDVVEGQGVDECEFVDYNRIREKELMDGRLEFKT